MLHKDNKDITGVYWNTRMITAIYRGDELVWQAINSCFGAGFWREDKPWSGTDGWRKLNG